MNRLKNKISEKGFAVGTLLSINSTAIAEALSNSGLDWLFFDLEHSVLDIAAVQSMIQAMNSECLSFIRLEDPSPVYVKRALDTGCDGIIVPQVNTSETGKWLLEAAMYPPQGTRSIGLGRAAGFGTNLAKAIQEDNERVSVIFQIEHRDAVSNIEQIASSPGLAGLFVRPYDLSGSFGKPGLIRNSEIEAAIEIAANQAKARGLISGIFVGNDSAALSAKAKGFQLICIGADILRISTSASLSAAALAAAST